MLSVMSIDQLSSFFAFEPYHLQLTFVGLVIILSFWLPRLCSRKEPVAAPLMLIFSGLAAFLLPALPPLPDPVSSSAIWERVSRRRGGSNERSFRNRSVSGRRIARKVVQASLFNEHLLRPSEKAKTITT
jgi:hypothetical protein